MTAQTLSTYELADFDRKKPFTSFLPGIAGLSGIPMWVFYVNRGQAVSSFGVGSKDRPLMEFLPANQAYQRTEQTGFRTFVRRVNGGGIYEPFCAPRAAARRTMWTAMNELRIAEESPGLETEVVYFTASHLSFAGLFRQVTLTNRGEEPLAVEILDGMPAMMCFGVADSLLKHMSRTLEAWMQVENREAGAPFFRLRASVGDTAEVKQVEGGNFAVGALSTADGVSPMSAHVDPVAVFGADTALRYPQGFAERGLAGLEAIEQITTGRTPCAFWGSAAVLAPQESVRWFGLYGYLPDRGHLDERVREVLTPGMIETQRDQARQLAEDLTDPIFTRSASPVFDAYCRQTLLDNILRGGRPTALGHGGRHIVHVYSRKHGDPERDYNAFSLAPQPYSQGNGNYRDVCQNRRSDALFYSQVGGWKLALHNLRSFLSLIQMDGFNPLVIEGQRFTIDGETADELVESHGLNEATRTVLAGSFAAGDLLGALASAGPAEAVLDVFHAVLERCEAHTAATFGEGYWVDHWTYTLDLVDTALTIYPESAGELFFGTRVPVFQSPATVRPRRERFVETARGPRQYGSLEEREDCPAQGCWLRDRAGALVETSVFVRLLMLAWIKTATLDPHGMGVEMEAGKPGWYDALNGLPGLLGSSMPETYELLRLVRMLRAALLRGETIDLPVELADFIEETQAVFETWLAAEPGPTRDLARWHAAADARESYRSQVADAVSGDRATVSGAPLTRQLDLLERILQAGIARARTHASGKTDVPVTYFRYSITDFSPAGAQDAHGRSYVLPQGFAVHPLPPFLEGAVHALKLSDSDGAVALHGAVQASALYDRELRMFKVNAPLHAESHEIGRAHAFPPGWLENESIWMHMEYKYLLELLRSGQYEAFYAAARDALPPFLDPARYGRSPLENVSFIASSAFPDPALHGNGFVARLSGCTAELLSMWFVMMTGGQPFALDDQGALTLSLSPKLPHWFFPEDGILELQFLGSVRVRCHNPNRRNTWESTPLRVVLQTPDGPQSFSGPTVPAPHAARVRDGQVSEMDLFLA